MAFVVGLVVAFAIGVGALYAYDQQYLGRVLPGVTIGTVDLSGVDPAIAAERLQAAYGSLSEGEIVLAGPDGPMAIPYDRVGRRADVEAMVAEALAVGRAGNPVERLLADARTALRGVTLAPRVTFDAQRTADQIALLALARTQSPVDAEVVVQGEDHRFVVAPGLDGRAVDASAAVATALATLGELDAPATLDLELVTTPIEPAVSTVEAFNAKALTDRLTDRITLAIDDVKDPQYLSALRLRTWTTFAPTADGGYGPSVDTSALGATLEKLAKKVDQAPVNASFKTKGGTITGVTPSKNATSSTSTARRRPSWRCSRPALPDGSRRPSNRPCR